jgi:hypothetical protein
VVILLIIAVVGGVWWNGTRDKDFLKSPSEEKLQELRIRVESSFPQAADIDDAVSEPVAPIAPEQAVVIEPPKPQIELGDLSAAPALAEYAELSPEGSAHLIALAGALEEQGHFQRALLAWERVIDLTKPDADQLITAVSAIKRLRPTLAEWNTDASKAITITLNAGTGRTLAKSLVPVLEQAASDLEKASDGILKVSAKVTAGESNLGGKGPTPVALWLAGAAKGSPSTEVLSFTVASPEVLRQEVLTTIFQLVRSHITQNTSYTTPAALTEQENPLEALSDRFSRLCWSEFATILNPSVEKTSAPAKKP